MSEEQFLCLSELECVYSQPTVEPFTVDYVCACSTPRTWPSRCYSICVKLHTHLLYVQVCERVHVVSLWKTQRCHGNTGQSVLGRRETWERRGCSLHHLGILTLWLRFSYRIFTHLTSHMSLESFCVSLFIFSRSLFISVSRASLHLLTLH